VSTTTPATPAETSTPDVPATMTANMAASMERTADFIDDVLADPTILDGIPNGAVLVLLTGDPAQDEIELASGVRSAREGFDVFIRHVHRPEEPDPAAGPPVRRPRP
jgi:hypothetical protein